MIRFFKDKRTIVLISSLVFVVIDQLIKLAITLTLNQYQSVVLIKGVLRFTFIYNDGAAFGIFGGGNLFLIIMTSIVLIVMFILLMMNRLNKKRYLIPLCMVFSGGLSNLIDRIFRGNVVDYIDLTFWPFTNFAIFNLADILVVLGAIILIVTIIVEEMVSIKNGALKKEKTPLIANQSSPNSNSPIGKRLTSSFKAVLQKLKKLKKRN